MIIRKLIAAAALVVGGLGAAASPAAASSVSTVTGPSAVNFIQASAASNIQRYGDDYYYGYGRDDRRWDRRDRRSRGWGRRGYDRRRYHSGRYYRSHGRCWNEWRRGRPVSVCAR